MKRLEQFTKNRHGGWYWTVCYNNALRRFKRQTKLTRAKAIKYANECIKPQNLWGGTL